jgi:hypothetical protein
MELHSAASTDPHALSGVAGQPPVAPVELAPGEQKPKQGSSSDQKVSRTKVFWTPEEWHDVVQRAAELILHSDYTKLEALNQAAQEMPEHRRRWFHSCGITMTPQYMHLLPAELQRQRDAMFLAKNAPKTEATEEVRPAPASAAVPVLQAAETAGALLSRALGAVLLEVLESPRGQAAIASALAAHLERQAPPKPTPTPAPTANVTAGYASRRPRVLVVGLLGVQGANIIQKYGERLELRLLGSDDKRDRIRDQAKSADLVFGMKSYIDGEVDRMLAKSHPGYVRVNGTSSELGRLLEMKLRELAS